MDLKNAEIGVTLEIDIFNQFFQELYNSEIFPNDIDLGNQDIPILGKKYVTVQVNQPEFSLNTPEGAATYTRLHITGTVELRPEDEPEGNIELPLPLDAFVRLTFVLQPVQNEAPKLGLKYDGLDGEPSPSQVTTPLDDFMKGSDVAPLLSSVSIDLFSPMIKSLEGIYYPDGNTPNRDSWPVQLFLYEGNDDFVDALAGFVAKPGQSADPSLNTSFLPNLMGLSLIFNKKMLDTNLKIAADKKAGTKIDGAKITRLSLTMQDDAIVVDGHAEKGGADIDFDGPIKMFLKRGTTDIGVNTSGIDVDVDKPWYYYLGMVFAGILFFVPVIGWLIDGFWLIPTLVDGDTAADGAPATVRGSFGRELDTQLDTLSEGLKFESDMQGITTDSTPDHLVVEDGNISLYAQVFVAPIREEMTNAIYNKRARRFMEYELESGRKFRFSELARLVRAGKITVPRYHDVDGDYMRSNPDTTDTNNLKETFWGK